MEATINRHRAEILVERYRFNLGLLMGKQSLGRRVMLFSLVIPFLGTNGGGESRSTLHVFWLGLGFGSYCQLRPFHGEEGEEYPFVPSCSFLCPCS